jgi:hypothetical protein
MDSNDAVLCNHNMIFLASMMSFLRMTIIQQETNIIGETDNIETSESQSPADDNGSSENVDGNFEALMMAGIFLF